MIGTNILLDLEAAACAVGVSYATARRWAAAGEVTTVGSRPRLAWTGDMEKVRDQQRDARRAGLRQFAV